MLKADIFELNNVEYIVIDTANITIEQMGLAKIASYRQGVGADRILLVDKQTNTLVAAADRNGAYSILSMSDYRIANIVLGKGEKTEEIYHIELHLTEHFVKQLIAPAKSMRIAGRYSTQSAPLTNEPLYSARPLLALFFCKKIP